MGWARQRGGGRCVEGGGRKGKQNAQETRKKRKINKSGEHRGRKKRGKTPLTSTGGHRRREINPSFCRIQEGH